MLWKQAEETIPDILEKLGAEIEDHRKNHRDPVERPKIRMARCSCLQSEAY
jgi:hypothetical protein